jgi:hypothetical protein
LAESEGKSKEKGLFVGRRHPALGSGSIYINGAGLAAEVFMDAEPSSA